MRASLPAAFVAASFLIVPIPRPLQRSAPEALRGLDPVLLVRGERREGQEEYSLIHDGYWYRFASGDNLAEFRLAPSRYAIALGGVCARMGGLAGGDSKIFSVCEDRIYIFSNQDCLQRFEAEPSRFIEKEAPPLQPTQNEAREALRLLDRMADALGGGAVLDRLEGYRLRSSYRLKTSRGEILMEAEILQRFDGYYRRTELRPFGPMVMARSPRGSFTQAQGRFQRLSRGQQLYLDTLQRRHLISLLRARRQPELVARLAPDGRLELSWGQVRVQLETDDRAGLVSMRYRARGQEGVWGRVEEVFSDRRAAGKLTSLPFRVDASWDGEPDIGRSLQVLEWRFDPPPAITEFSPPKPGFGIPNPEEEYRRQNTGEVASRIQKPAPRIWNLGTR